MTKQTKQKIEAPKDIDLLTACSIVEGFNASTKYSNEEIQQAWSFLIKTGHCWKLQGWYGRTATYLIENGIISQTGKILYH